MNEAPDAVAALARPSGSATGRPPRWIASVLRTNAVLFVGFFGFAFLAVALDIPLGERLEDLTRWGQHGHAYELMITSVYAVWGCYLWAAARSPLDHRLFLGFTVTANAVHFTVMLLEAVLMEDEHLHLVGDVLLGWVSVISLAVAVRALRPTRPARTRGSA